MKRSSRLNALRIETPCPVPWASMTGDDRVRFCGHCRKNVYNVASLAPDEALNLIEAAEGGLCLRLSRRPDGTLVTGDCRARLRYARRRGRLAFVAALVVVFAVQVWTMAFGLRALLGPRRSALQAPSRLGATMVRKPFQSEEITTGVPPTSEPLTRPQPQMMLGMMKRPPPKHPPRR